MGKKDIYCVVSNYFVTVVGPPNRRIWDLRVHPRSLGDGGGEGGVAYICLLNLMF